MPLPRRRPVLLPRAAALLALALLACGGGGGTDATPREPTGPTGPTPGPVNGAPAGLRRVDAQAPAVVLGRPLATAPAVQLVDHRQAPAPRAGVTITAELDGAEPGTTLAGATATTNAQGLAVFDALAVQGEIGGAALRFRSAGLPDVVSGRFVLVPDGVVAATNGDNADGRIVTLTTTGATTARLDTRGIRTTNEVAGLDWDPTGTTLVLYHVRTDRVAAPRDFVLFAVDAAGRERQLVAPGAHDLEAESHPQYTADGAWIYFVGRPGNQNGEIWRVRADGSGAARVGPAVTSWADLDAFPSPSPDGRRVVFSTNRGHADGRTLSILDVESGVVTDLPVHGEHPRWSPTGEWIAFTDTYRWLPGAGDAGTGPGLRIMRPDGSDVQVVTRDGVSYSAGLDWSPDGRYLLARGPAGLEIVDVARRAHVVVPNGAALSFATWAR